MIEVNLLPQQPKKASGKRRQGRPGLSIPRPGPITFGKDPWLTALVAALVVVPAVVLTLWLVQRAEARGIEDRLVTATADSARLAELRAVSDSLTERRQQLEERMSLIERLDRDRFVWPRIMDELSRALPELAWLTNVRQMSPVPNVNFQIQGLAANPLVITDFVRTLKASPYIADVRILGSQQQEIEGLALQAFTLVASFQQPPELERRAASIPVTGD